MKKRMAIAVIALVVVFGGIFGYVAFRNYMMGQFFADFSQPPSTVSTTEARTVRWQPRLAAVGSLSAVQGVDVSNEVPGLVETINFESGQMVEEGDVLVQIDDDREQAELPGLEARANLARSNLQRTRSLIERDLTSEENLETALSQLQEAESAVASLEATIAKKAIRAPFDGTLGIRQINEGQFLPAGTAIVTLQHLDKLYADFTLPEKFLDRVSVGQPVEVRVSTWPDRVFEGRINAVSVKVDVSSHNFAAQATIDNPDHLLRPGMFADVAALAGDRRTVVALPDTAIDYSLYGDAVYVINDTGEKDDEGNPLIKVEERFVQTGQTHEGWTEILEGVKAGETVVTAGQLKLRDGARVMVNNEVTLGGEPDFPGGEAMPAGSTAGAEDEQGQ